MLQTGIYVGASVGSGLRRPSLGPFGPPRHVLCQPQSFLLAAAVIISRFVREESRVSARAAGPFVKSLIPDFSPLGEHARAHRAAARFRRAAGREQNVAPILPLFIQAISPQTTKVGSMTGLILGGSAVRRGAFIGRAGPGELSA